eukprot:4122996-Lingulodinium_polyedra.AAC.1
MLSVRTRCQPLLAIATRAGWSLFWPLGAGLLPVIGKVWQSSWASAASRLTSFPWAAPAFHCATIWWSL